MCCSAQAGSMLPIPRILTTRSLHCTDVFKGEIMESRRPGTEEVSLSVEDGSIPISPRPRTCMLLCRQAKTTGTLRKRLGRQAPQHLAGLLSHLLHVAWIFSHVQQRL